MKALFSRVRRLYATTTLFSEKRIVRNFLTMHSTFPTAEIISAAQITPSIRAPSQHLAQEIADENWRAWLRASRCTGFVVLQHGRIVDEHYFEGSHPNDLRILWSITKSFISALIGICLQKGDITSADDPVDRYVPALATTAYAGVTIRNVLMMSSGLAFDEDYQRFFSDINKMGRVLALGRSMDKFVLSQKRSAGPQGQARRYNSIDTHVLGMVLRGATKRPIEALLRSWLIEPLQFEHPARLLSDVRGEPIVLGGLMISLRDLAKFGQLYLNKGRVGEQQIVPANWVEDSTRNIAPADALGSQLGYGYHWWIPPEARAGEYFANGIYGQYLYVDTLTQTVIAMTSADRLFALAGRQSVLTNLSMFRAIAKRHQK